MCDAPGRSQAPERHNTTSQGRVGDLPMLVIEGRCGSVARLWSIVEEDGCHREQAVGPFALALLPRSLKAARSSSTISSSSPYSNQHHSNEHPPNRTNKQITRQPWLTMAAPSAQASRVRPDEK